MAKRFGERVPKDRRNKFLKDQQALIHNTMSDLSPHADRIEYIDNRSLTGNPYNGLYRVWIHADKVYSSQTRKDTGVFVIYQVSPINEIPEAKKSRVSEANTEGA